MNWVVMVPGISKPNYGVGRHIQEICTRLGKMGFNVVNVSPSRSRKFNLRIINDSFVFLEIPVAGFQFLRTNLNQIDDYLGKVLHYCAYREAVRKITIDLNRTSILHTHGFCTISQPKHSRFKRISTIHGFGQLDMMLLDRAHFKATLLHSILRKIYSNADHYTTFSDRMKEMASQLYEIEPSRLSVVPHGVDASFFSRKTDSEKIGKLESRFNINKRYRVIFLGHLVKGKGIDILLSAFKILKGRRNDVILLLKIGKEESREVYDLVERLDIKEVVRVITDYLDETDFRALYRLSNIFVNFHMLSGGYSTALLEAMACGIPPIIYRNSTNADIVDESCGILLETLDAQELVNAIETLIDENGLSRRLGQNAQDKVTKDYDWDRAVVPQYASLYKALIDR